MSDSPDVVVEGFERLKARQGGCDLVVSPTARATVDDVSDGVLVIRDRIRRARLQSHSMIGMSVPNGPVFLATYLALRAEGHPVLLMDSSAPELQNTRVAATMQCEAVMAAVSGWSYDDESIQLKALGATSHHFHSDQIAVVKLTSGSTGMPRGVAMRSPALLADESALAAAMGFSSQDRLLATVPMSHSYGFTTLALTAIVRGLPLIVAHEEGGPFLPLVLGAQCRASIFPTVPAYLQALVAMREEQPWPASIRLVISAGAILPARVAAAFRQRYGQPIHTFYGSSECGGICYDRDGGAAERGTVGAAVPGVTIALDNPTAEGDGIVMVRSPGVGDYYLPDPEPERLGDGRFQSSDVGQWVQGELMLRGRVDRMINIRGRKVDPAEVEQTLRRAAGVEDVLVIGTEIDDSEVVCAIIATALPEAALYESLVILCRQQLADYKIPRRFAFTTRIQYTARGKVDRTWTRQLFTNRAVDRNA